MNMKVIADRDILLAEYTLGLLSPSETAHAHALLGEDPQAIVEALAWENRFLELTDLLTPVDPSPLLLQRIQATLGHDTTPALSSLYRKPDNDTPPEPTIAAAPVTKAAKVEPVFSNGRPQARTPAIAPATSDNRASGADQAPPEQEKIIAPVRTPAPPPPTPDARRAPRANIWAWRLATFVFAFIALFLGLVPAEPLPPPVTVIELAPTHAAILQAPGQSSTPGWVVTVDPQRNVLMDPRVRSDIPADASVQLWTHNRNMPQPRSLGLIDPNKPVTVPASLIGNIEADQIFEMTLEPAGGSPTASPSGPILFIGRLVTFGDPVAPPGPSTTAPAPDAGS